MEPLPAILDAHLQARLALETGCCSKYCSRGRYSSLTTAGRSMVHVPFCLGAIGVFHSVPAGEAPQEHSQVTLCSVPCRNGGLFQILPHSFQIDPDPPFLIIFLFLVDLQKREGPTMPRQCLDLAGWRCQGLEAFSVCLGKDHEGRDHDLGPPGHQGGKPESQRSCRHNNQGPGWEMEMHFGSIYRFCMIL